MFQNLHIAIIYDTLTLLICLTGKALRVGMNTDEGVLLSPMKLPTTTARSGS